MEPDLADALKTLGNPARLEFLRWLRTPEESFRDFEPIADRAEVGVCVTHLAGKSGLAQSTVSTYMAALERIGVVRSTRVGKWTHYRRDERGVGELVRRLGAVI
ncbi:transcriptional regulator [Kineococcus sp. NPDC059986]|uniref:ArsR/SmtB family transcription factor n=1 Tax=Kineococcus sp. NPDC059986 TaxID=3155538 RepID=UPI00344D847B